MNQRKLIFVNWKVSVCRLMLLCALLAVLVIVGCPFYRFFETPCPACGVTRAWLALLHGNVRLAFSYHPLFWLLPFLPLALLWRRHIQGGRRHFVPLCLGILVFLVYLVRLIGTRCGYPFFPE
ncbi:MAG: DUF2752 domain-containing protein [Clostridia bacterium]|nr:DUF2752 domain-containing protein [Clostridia bacterium]